MSQVKNTMFFHSLVDILSLVILIYVLVRKLQRSYLQKILFDIRYYTIIRLLNVLCIIRPSPIVCQKIKNTLCFLKNSLSFFQPLYTRLKTLGSFLKTIGDYLKLAIKNPVLLFQMRNELFPFLLFQLRFRFSKLLECGYLCSNGPMYTLTFFSGEQKYKFLFSKKRCMWKYIKILDGHGNDVTNDIKMYAGPTNNFFGQKLLVQDLGYDKLFFYRFDGTMIELSNDQIITL